VGKVLGYEHLIYVICFYCNAQYVASVGNFMDGTWLACLSMKTSVVLMSCSCYFCQWFL
jgi:hypothetical protein